MIDLALLQTIHNKMIGKCKYRLGAKARSLSMDSNDISHIDCSGDSRYLVARASNQELIIPDGSMNQLDYAKRYWRQLEKYEDVEYAAKDPSRLFIAFMAPTEEQRRMNAMDDRARGRHVWLLKSNGEEMLTIESKGGKGCTSQPWNQYKSKWCFEIPTG